MPSGQPGAPPTAVVPSDQGTATDTSHLPRLQPRSTSTNCGSAIGTAGGDRRSASSPDGGGSAIGTRECATDNSLRPRAVSRALSAPANRTAGGDGQAAATAPPSVLPAEAEMSAADRRQVQEALRRLGYYKGPADGIFGPLTRAAIRRFQQDIRSDATGYLTADQANRLVTPR